MDLSLANGKRNGITELPMRRIFFLLVAGVLLWAGL